MFRNNAAELLAAGYTYHTQSAQLLRQGGACSCGTCHGNAKDQNHPGYIRAALVSDPRSPFTPAHTDILAGMDTDMLLARYRRAEGWVRCKSACCRQSMA